MQHSDTGTVPLMDSRDALGSAGAKPLKELRMSLGGNSVLVVIVATSFALLVAAALLVFEISRDSEEAEQAVVHTLEVKQSAADLLNLISAAESGQRGYLLTGEESLLAPYEAARASLDSQLSKLRELVADNPGQIRRVDDLTPVIIDRLGAIEQTLSFIRDQRREEAARVVRERGAPLMVDLRRHFLEFDQAENRLLFARQAHARAVRNQFIAAVTMMLAACGALAVLALISVRRYLGAVNQSSERLAMYNKDLERRVAERTEELARAAQLADRERMRAETLLTDVNHRVGNNLALVSSFLTMQQRVVKSPEAARALNAARARVQAIASAHRKLRLGTDFATVKAHEVLSAVLDDIAAGLPPGDQIKIQRELAPASIAARDAVTLGVLSSELVMNAVKHAFPAGEGGEVNVIFRCESGAAPFLEVSDNGVGWHEKYAGEAQGLGARIIEMVARQFGGAPERSLCRDDRIRPGTRVKVRLEKLQVHA